VDTEVSGDGGHQGIRVGVRERGVIVLENQAESDAFSSWFYARTLVDIKGHELAQPAARDNTNTTEDGA
jgi:hypothetical protein